MKLFSFCLLTLCLLSFSARAQQLHAIDPRHTIKCATEQSIREAIRKNPAIVEKWRREGERRMSIYLENQELHRGQGIQEETIIIPVVFHLVDEAAKLNWITDRDIYNQLELLNEGFNGLKADFYKQVIPKGMYDRLGRIKIKFVLARRTPAGKLTSGIQRREHETPHRIHIKSTANGGLDAWDTDRYLNIWAGTFSGEDNGLLGVATPPFYTSEGPQGVVINIGTIPYTSNVTRSYYPTYSEGTTLIHEVGHYFYLWHTFGDQYVCNNDDFRVQSGWPLPSGAGPEGDDTPPEKADDKENAHYGNPSENYSDGCSALPIGMMYGSFMNYFDDRAMFMFSEGMRKRVIGCIDLYRPKLKTSPGGTPPSTVTDAYLVSANPYGTPERRAFIANETPLRVRIRNYGNTVLNQITLNVQADAQPAAAHVYPLTLAPGEDTVLSTQNISGVPGTHLLTIYTSKPNNKADDFTHNDTLQSFIFITGGSITAPFTESFNSGTFPPPGWQVWNPNNNITWTRDANSGFTAAGSAAVLNYNYTGVGQLDELITPAIYTGVADSAILSFKLAYAVQSLTDVAQWDGLEIYVSTNKGADYQLVYKKSGNFLKSVTAVQKGFFSAAPGSPDRWKTQTINLKPYLKGSEPLFIKFRNVTAYGNNLYLDDISVTPYLSVDRDVMPYAILNLPEIVCAAGTAPSVAFKTNGKQPLSSLQINYKADNGSVTSKAWNGNLTIAQADTVNLSALPSLAPGRHELTVYTSAPNGLSDLNPVNDTIRKTFYVPGTQELPVRADFETPAFPPAGWLVIDAGSGHTWRRTTTASSGGTASMMIENSKSNVQGAVDKFGSPVITGNTDYDSLFVSFDYAYSKGSGAGIDTLEIMISKDCGGTMQSIWKKWGADLETVTGNASSFVPGAGDWDSIIVDLLPFVKEGDFQVFFISKSNGGNNVYIDNIQIYGLKVPARLKEQGYLIYPNPFNEEFIIRHYELPDGLKSAALFSSSGQKVWQQEFNGNANKQIFVNIPGLPPGVYSLRLVYHDGKVVEKVVKGR